MLNHTVPQKVKTLYNREETTEAMRTAQILTLTEALWESRNLSLYVPVVIRPAATRRPASFATCNSKGKIKGNNDPRSRFTGLFYVGGSKKQCPVALARQRPRQRKAVIVPYERFGNQIHVIDLRRKKQPKTKNKTTTTNKTEPKRNETKNKTKKLRVLWRSFYLYSKSKWRDID